LGKNLLSYPLPSLPGSVWGILLLGFAARSLIAFWLLPGYDEGYYYLYAKYLNWSYFDHPPLVALTTGFGIWLTGTTNAFALRWGTLILYTGSLVFLYLCSIRIFNSRVAQLTLIIGSSIPIFQVAFGVVTLPDNPLIFFWTATLYCAACEFFPRADRSYSPTYRVAILGGLAGLACLGKYHGFTLGMSLIAFCMASPVHRRIFRSPWLGWAIVFFGLTIFPIIFWNNQHDWVSFRFQLFERFSPVEGGAKSFHLFGTLNVLLIGIGLLFPSFGLPMLWVLFRTGFYAIASCLQIFPRSKAIDASSFGIQENSYFREKIWFILWVSLPLILGFAILGGREQVLITWPMPGYWSATLLLGLYAAKWEKRSRRWVRWWLIGSAIAIYSLLLILLVHIHLGIFFKANPANLGAGLLDPEQDASTELIDVKQLRQGFIDSPILARALRESAFVFTNAYYLGGLIEMAIKPLTPIPVTCFSYDRRGFAYWPDTDRWLGRDALYVTLERFHKMPHLNREFSPYFQSWQELGTISIKRGGAIVNVFHVYRAKKLLKPYTPPLFPIL
jgi:hypothetical protein